MAADNLGKLIRFILSKNGVADKAELAQQVKQKFSLVTDGSIFYSKDYAIRFSESAKQQKSYSNGIISLSTLQKYDHLPVISCMVTPKENILLLANSTFIDKVSHSSQELREDNIRGTFIWNNIVQEFQGVKNTPGNFNQLFDIHSSYGFDANLPRIVEVTTGILAKNIKLSIAAGEKETILQAPSRAMLFVSAKEYEELSKELDAKVKKYAEAIICASFIENTNIRGQIIEYLIAGDDNEVRTDLINSLKSKNKPRAPTTLDRNLGDYIKDFDSYYTATDIKTKIMHLSSNPKGYNIDKLLEFLIQPRSVFMFYFIGIDDNKNIKTSLISVFQDDLLKSYRIFRHWAGRTARGTVQLDGETVKKLVIKTNNDINKREAQNFIDKLIDS